MYKMSNQIVAVIVCALIFCVALSSCKHADTPGCQPGIVEEMPPHIRKVCVALENSDELSSALRTYINKELGSIEMDLNGLRNNNEKRTDVDHVFLRFGKRR